MDRQEAWKTGEATLKGDLEVGDVGGATLEVSTAPDDPAIGQDGVQDRWISGEVSRRLETGEMSRRLAPGVQTGGLAGCQQGQPIGDQAGHQQRRPTGFQAGRRQGWPTRVQAAETLWHWAAEPCNGVMSHGDHAFFWGLHRNP